VPAVPHCANSLPNADSRAFSFSHLTVQQLEFLMRVTPSALVSESEYGIPACVTIAQAILESATAAGWGGSSLFRLANNPFGIKYCHFSSGDREIGRSGDRTNSNEDQTADPRDHKATGECAYINDNPQFTRSPNHASARRPGHPTIGSPDHPIPEPYGAFAATTWEIENGQKKITTAEFERFPNLEEAFRAHALLLCSPRYRPAYAVRHDWKQFAERLGPKTSQLDSEHCGYSTNPSYSAELIKLVILYRLDDPRAQQWCATGKDPGTGYGNRVRSADSDGVYRTPEIGDTGHGAEAAPRISSPAPCGPKLRVEGAHYEEK
jgi:hypothetical protein